MKNYNGVSGGAKPPRLHTFLRFGFFFWRFYLYNLLTFTDPFRHASVIDDVRIAARRTPRAFPCRCISGILSSCALAAIEGEPWQCIGRNHRTAYGDAPLAGHRTQQHQCRLQQHHQRGASPIAHNQGRINAHADRHMHRAMAHHHLAADKNM